MRSVLILDMSYTLKMFRERQMEQALESRKLDGYFGKVVSVHPLAGLFEFGNERFGDPVITQLDDAHVFVEGKIGVGRTLRFIPLLNLFLAQINLVHLLYKISKKAKVDVIRIGDPYFLGILGWILSRLLRVPLAARVNANYDDLSKITGKAVFPRLFRYRMLEKVIERFVFPKCDLIAGANQNNLDYAIKNGGLSTNGVVFRYGNLIHPLHFTEPASRNGGAQVMKSIGLGREFLITVTRLEEIKYPDHILLVMKRLLDTGHDVDFVYVGDGSMQRRLEEMSNELGLAGHIIFAGNRPQEWIAAILPFARLALSPHMGRALAETCLAGVPVVAYDLDWQGEIIQSGVTGELVPVGDWEEMARRSACLLADPEQSTRLGQNARCTTMEIMDPALLVDMEVEAYEALSRKLLR